MISEIKKLFKKKKKNESDNDYLGHGLWENVQFSILLKIILSIDNFIGLFFTSDCREWLILFYFFIFNLWDEIWVLELRGMKFFTCVNNYLICS
jgi:hypothetical protein